MKIFERNIQVEIKPTVEEIAQIIWDMDDQEQYELLGELHSRAFKNVQEGCSQLSAVRQRITEDFNKHFSGKVKEFIWYLYDYLYKE